MKEEDFPFNKSALKGHRALICGASKGIGKEDAKSMAKVGADVIICSRNKESLEKIINELIKKHKTNFKGVGQPLRIALVGSKFGPGIYDTILSLDKNEVIGRLKAVS